MHLAPIRIDDNHSIGQYYLDDGYTFTITIRSDDYINATKLCTTIKERTGKKPRVPDWLQNDKTQALMKHMEKPTRILVGHLTDTVTSGSMPTRGIYIHPILVSSFIEWANVEYYFVVRTMLHQRYMNEATRLKDIEIAKLAKDNRVKDSKIDTLNTTVSDLREELRQHNAKMDAKISAVLNHSETISVKLSTAEGHNQELKTIVIETKEEATQAKVEAIHAKEEAYQAKVEATQAKVEVIKVKKQVKALDAKFKVALSQHVQPPPSKRVESFILLNKPNSKEYRCVHGKRRNLPSAITRRMNTDTLLRYSS